MERLEKSIPSKSETKFLHVIMTEPFLELPAPINPSFEVHDHFALTDCIRDGDFLT
jgi:hypothetical protein